jgi:hypothetical protein
LRASSRQFGGGKTRRQVGPRPLFAPVIARHATSRVAGAKRQRQFGVILELWAAGGILAGMDWAANHGTETLASFTCNAPYFPLDLVARLVVARDGDNARIACGFGRPQVFGLCTVAGTVAGIVARRVAPRRALRGAGSAQGRCLGRTLPPDGGVISHCVRSILFSTSTRRQFWQKRSRCLPGHVRLIVVIPGV